MDSKSTLARHSFCIYYFYGSISYHLDYYCYSIPILSSGVLASVAGGGQRWA